MSDNVSFPVPEIAGLTITELRTDERGHIFSLNDGGSIESGGLWRLLVNGSIAATELDCGQSDWRPKAPAMVVQVRDQLRTRLFNKPVLSAVVSVPTGDLCIDFPDSVRLEFIKLHSFLESWQVRCAGMILLVDAWGEVNKWR